LSPEEELVKAGQAAQVLDSAIFIEAKQRVIDGIHAKMKAVPLSDEKMHTRLICLLQCWTSLESYLEGVRETGKLADFQIRATEEQKRRISIFGRG
jgi:hypothetical protein